MKKKEERGIIIEQGGRERNGFRKRRKREKWILKEEEYREMDIYQGGKEINGY